MGSEVLGATVVAAALSEADAELLVDAVFLAGVWLATRIFATATNLSARPGKAKTFSRSGD